MDFINYISQTGCAIKCFFDETYISKNSPLQLITSKNMEQRPESLDLKTTLLLSTLIAKFLKFDPFSYNQETGKGYLSINGKKYEIEMPQHLHSLFSASEIENRDILQKKIYDDILVLLTDEESQKMFEYLKNMKEQTDMISVIRNDESVVVGVGKIFDNN